MKHLFSTAAIALILAATAHAGVTVEPKSTPSLTPVCGTGLYIGVQGGFNAYQTTPGAKTFRYGSDATETYSFDSKVGGFAGLKAGYVFGTGKIRPAVELDAFYNGYNQDLRYDYRATDFHVNGLSDKADVDSAAYLVNALVRFDLGKIQPYVGAGIGGYTAETTVNAFYNTTHSSWAWQIIAGADYYITPTVSVFAEYKFLNYMNPSPIYGVFDQSRVGQQLAGMGLRFHF